MQFRINTCYYYLSKIESTGQASFTQDNYRFNISFALTAFCYPSHMSDQTWKSLKTYNREISKHSPLGAHFDELKYRMLGVTFFLHDCHPSIGKQDLPSVPSSPFALTRNRYAWKRVQDGISPWKTFFYQYRFPAKKNSPNISDSVVYPATVGTPRICQSKPTTEQDQNNDLFFHIPRY